MSVIQRQIEVRWPLRVFFTENVFAVDNSVLRDALADTAQRKVLVVIDDGLAQAQPDLEQNMADYFSRHAKDFSFVRSPLEVPGGEAAKNSNTLIGHLLSQIQRHHLDRHSYLLAIGGGALLDVAGFAAATAHRGLRLVRVPSTTLAQADSGVGVKNGINSFSQKNFIGTFAPPFAVFNDFNLLATLKPADKRAGYVEAVKVACIRDATFFGEIERDAEKLVSFDPTAMKHLIYRSAELHLNHIANSGDPFETGSARPLDFGHWAAHKLEQVSRFHISHGNAVAVGLALDVIYSRNAGMLAADDCERILQLLKKLGFNLFTDELLNADDANRLTLLSGLEEFREHLGGELTITLLEKIGHGMEVHEMDDQKIVAAIHELRKRCATT